MVATVAAIMILAFCTRPLGVLPSVALAGAVAALGVRGVDVLRAALIGLCLSAGAAVLFVVLLRQPLPLLPGMW